MIGCLSIRNLSHWICRDSLARDPPLRRAVQHPSSFLGPCLLSRSQEWDSHESVPNIRVELRYTGLKAYCASLFQISVRQFKHLYKKNKNNSFSCLVRIDHTLIPYPLHYKLHPYLHCIQLIYPRLNMFSLTIFNVFHTCFFNVKALFTFFFSTHSTFVISLSIRFPLVPGFSHRFCCFLF